MRGVEIAEWHEDLDVSGGKLERPGLDKLMGRIRAGQTGGLAVARLDRLSRAGVGDALKLVQEIHDAGGQLAAIDLGIDPATEFGEFGLTIMLALARMERRRITAGWANAQRRAVARGVHIASRCPTGYVRRDDGRLEPHPTDAPVVAELFRMKAAGASWGELADYLNSTGTQGPYKAELWTNRAMSHILQNRVYLGEARSGKHVNPDAHAPIVDRATWQAAQVARGTAPSRSGDGAALAGLLRCAGCRHVLKADKMTDRDGTRLRMYRCRKFHSTGECPAPVTILERKVLPNVELLFHWFVREQTGFKTVTLGEKSDGPHELEAAITAAEAELEAYRDEQIVGVLGAERYVAGLEKRVAALDAATAALAEARLAPGEEITLDFRDEVWPRLSTAERRKWFFRLWGAVMVRPADQGLNRLAPIMRGQLPDDFPRRGRRVPMRSWAWPDESQLPREAIEVGLRLGRGEWPSKPGLTTSPPSS